MIPIHPELSLCKVLIISLQEEEPSDQLLITINRLKKNISNFWNYSFYKVIKNPEVFLAIFKVHLKEHQTLIPNYISINIKNSNSFIIS
jgi:hypothetical protein